MDRSNQSLGKARVHGEQSEILLNAPRVRLLTRVRTALHRVVLHAAFLIVLSASYLMSICPTILAIFDIALAAYVPSPHAIISFVRAVLVAIADRSRGWSGVAFAACLVTLLNGPSFDDAYLTAVALAIAEALALYLTWQRKVTIPVRSTYEPVPVTETG